MLKIDNVYTRVDSVWQKANFLQINPEFNGIPIKILTWSEHS